MIMFIFILEIILTFNCVHSQTELILPELPYAYNELEPVLSERLMQIHHGKHFQTYANNTNIALKTLFADANINNKIKALTLQPIEIILTQLSKLPNEFQTYLRHNGGGYINHKLFFSMLQKPTKTADENKPTGLLLEAIERTFGSFDAFKTYFNTIANNFFGYGWIWFYIDGTTNQPSITYTFNQDNPIMYDKNHIILLGIDLWEHAYYLTYENRRQEYVDNFWRIVNWSFVDKLYQERETI